METLVLPTELERHVFELCVCSRPETVPTLMLVAWRVKEWVEPFLYRTLITLPLLLVDRYPMLTERTLSTVLRSKPPAFFHNSVRHLFVYTFRSDFVKFVLSICTGVQNLWSFQASNLLVDLSVKPLPLKRLHTTPMPLFLNVSPSDPLFSRLTHLELMGSPKEDIDISATLALLPRLTHLAFNENHTAMLISSYNSVLHNCTSLLVLVSLRGRSFATSSLHEEYEDDLLQDSRFVVVTIGCLWFEDWQMEVLNGTGYWNQAEAFIAKRRAGEIDATEYMIPYCTS
ncbi:hypothetical protein MVEN_00540400 [Mycena venus]|uniref:Uncharacterized protein n=1 Tax=Mycena venus TaxID=2733690 RepID=A0A8H6YP67_9AGAR|nr:hypothetical protein MVEN_00540400 [Mycena venus]